jgi:hypothetical protein
MAFSKAKIHNVNTAGLAAQNEIGSLHVTVNKAPLVYFPNRSEHFREDVNSDFEAVILFEATAHLGQIDSHQVHHNQVLLRIVYKIINVWYMLQAYICAHVKLLPKMTYLSNCLRPGTQR